MLSLSTTLFGFLEGPEEESTILELDYLKKKQNKDGSFGSREKEVLTSLALLTFLSNGETPTSKKYGMSVKKAMQYLCELSKKIKGEDKLSVADLYVLWAVSESYAMTGVSLLETSTETLCKHVLKHYGKKTSFKLNKESYSHVSFILSNALYSAKVTGIDLLDGVDLKSMMISAIRNSKDMSPMNSRDKVIMRFIQLRWRIEDKEIYFFSDLKKDYTKKEQEVVEGLLLKLNGNSKERKIAFSNALELSLEVLPLLVNKLSESKVVELMEVSKDIKESVKLTAPLLNPYKVHAKLKDSHCDLLLASLVYFSQQGNDWKWWSRSLQKSLTSTQNVDGSWPEHIKTPKILNLKGSDRVLFNTCFGALNLTIYYRYLPGFNMPKVLRNHIIPEEEGLDLID